MEDDAFERIYAKTFSTKPIKQDRVYGSTHREMDDVYEDAPPKAKRLVAHIKDPEALRRPNLRYAFFYGEPGCGKSTLAKAIATRSDSLIDFVQCGELQCVAENQRNQTGINLYNRLQDAIRFQVPVVVILDEINDLLENFDDSHHDTGYTSKVLWNFLDSQAGNNNFFLIGTMNRAHKLPKPMKSRAKGFSVEIVAPQDPKKRIRILKNVLEDEHTVLHGECDDSFLLNFMQKTKGFNGRDYQLLATEAVGLHFDEHGKQNIRKIAIRHLNDALKDLRKVEEDFDYNTLEETEEERQDRQFVQGGIKDVLVQMKQKGTTTGGIPGILSRTSKGGLNRGDAKDIIKESYSKKQLDHHKKFLGRKTVFVPNIREDIGLTDEL